MKKKEKSRDKYVKDKNEEARRLQMAKEVEELKNRNIWAFETEDALDAPIDIKIKPNYLDRTKKLEKKLESVETKPKIEKTHMKAGKFRSAGSGAQ